MFFIDISNLQTHIVLRFEEEEESRQDGVKFFFFNVIIKNVTIIASLDSYKQRYD